jgi:hypothetical protein
MCPGEAYIPSRVKDVASTKDGIWRLARWARNRGATRSFTPPLRKTNGEMEHDYGAKAEMFKEAFFPLPPEVDLSDI